jgi:hypothetical protein
MPRPELYLIPPIAENEDEILAEAYQILLLDGDGIREEAAINGWTDDKLALYLELKKQADEYERRLDA